jgi:hypothetical protein
MVVVAFAIAASSKSSLNREPKLATAETPGFSMSRAGIFAKISSASISSLSRYKGLMEEVM